MKKTILPAICILLCTLCILLVPTEADAAIYEDTVRLHILAPSDSVEDQALKLRVRDMVLERYGADLGGSKNAKEARDRLEGKLNDIKSDCERLIFNTGYDYSVSVILTEEWYGTKEYSDFTLPSGTYTSLKITIGEGEGQNWWCVMYPPLCLDASLGTASGSDETSYEGEAPSKSYGYTDEEYALIYGGYNIKFKLLEVASYIFN